MPAPFDPRRPNPLRRRLHRAIVGTLLAVATATVAAQASPRPCRDCPRPAAAPRAPEFASADDAVLAARQALARNDAARIAQAATFVPNDHPLRAYVEGWQLRAQLAELRTGGLVPLDTDVRAFVAMQTGSLNGDLVRRDWLMSLGRRQLWAAFDEQLPDLVQRDDPIRCHALQARRSFSEPVAVEARELLLQPRELPDACQALLSALAASGEFTAADLWTRLERALESGSAAAVRRAVTLAAPSIEARSLETALARPAAMLSQSPSRELAVIAIATLARADPTEAADAIRAAAPRLRPADRPFLWSQVAAGGMRRMLPEAHAWAREARAARPSDDTLAWIVRAGLRAGDWPLVRGAIERMTEAGRADPAWTYWLARALLAQDDRAEHAHRARVMLTAMSGRADFYSQLAAEELGLRHAAPARAAAPTDAELAAARERPGVQRALKFYELGLRLEGNREWNFTMRGLADRELLAAAEHARRLNLLDRTIAAADRTREEHDFTLRFPKPFHDRLAPVAREHGLDPAWVYGLIRQESRFIMDARSHVGASGLMQIMPGTARWIAKRMGARDFQPSRINELDTNLQFGSFYLKTVHDELDRSPVLASAAYNAGPGRPRSWRGTLSRPLEGAVFAEIIPFTETRGYVKNVLSNTVWYAALFTGEPQSLKAWLGEVQPGPAFTASAAPGAGVD
jgi:soluble lytic murein transglycosylase